ncbi:MAG TPA: organomercurial lyase [Gemmatimonadaceae bacterium]|jgi:hypothetical protein|nr:organomercurial lyase [Gemmatimonadaceae bacterium]
MDSIRAFVYDRIIDDGVVPSIHQIAAHVAMPRADAAAAIRSAGFGKTLLLHPRSDEIWMAGPFSASPTPYRVRAGTRAWWANCAWDMLGVAAVVGEAVHMETRCADCGASIDLDVDPQTAAIGDLVVHFLLPARRWYDDIGFT